MSQLRLTVSFLKKNLSDADGAQLSLQNRIDTCGVLAFKALGTEIPNRAICRYGRASPDPVV